MRQLGKWLMYVGFGIPFIFSLITFSRMFAASNTNQVDAAKINQHKIALSLDVGRIGIPIGFVGLGSWLIGVVGEAHQSRKLKKTEQRKSAE